MSPDDPRHGTHAGAIAHWRAKQTPCDDCALAARRLRKRNQLMNQRGFSPTVELGEKAWQVINTTPLNQLAEQLGIRHAKLIHYRNGGPTKRVHRTTRDRILSGRTEWTPIGIQRRLQALSRLGWSMRIIANETGCDMDSLKRLRRRERVQFVRLEAGRSIVDVYERMHMTLPPSGRSASRARTTAIQERWAPPLAWDDIDHDATPADGETCDVDPVVVMRLLEGQKVKSTTAEKEAAMARWVADGGSRAELARWHGWKAERYTAGLRVLRGGAA